MAKCFFILMLTNKGTIKKIVLHIYTKYYNKKQ